jgi:hypothetical protein
VGRGMRRYLDAGRRQRLDERQRQSGRKAFGGGGEDGARIGWLEGAWGGDRSSSAEVYNPGGIGGCRCSAAQRLREDSRRGREMEGREVEEEEEGAPIRQIGFACQRLQVLPRGPAQYGRFFSFFCKFRNTW